MLATEIVLIVIGVAFLVGSYFIEEKFSEKDILEISKMSEAQLNMVVDKQVKTARTQVENSVDEIIDESLAVTKRGLEKETNEKIMAISEYSDTVMEEINKIMAKAPIKVGDVLIKNVLDTGVDVVATKNIDVAE